MIYKVIENSVVVAAAARSRAHFAVQIQSSHQANGTHGKLRGLQNGMIAKDTHFEAAATKIGDAASLPIWSKRGEYCFPAKTGFFARADHFQPDTRFLLDALHEGVSVGGFARSAGGDCAVPRHPEFLHAIVEVAKGLSSFLENILAETIPYEDTFTETKRVALVMQRFDIESRVRADN